MTRKNAAGEAAAGSSQAATSDAPLAKAADWERHRAKITELYRDKGLHLDQVIAIMSKEHSFHAK